MKLFSLLTVGKNGYTRTQLVLKKNVIFFRLPVQFYSSGRVSGDGALLLQQLQEQAALD